MKLYPIGSYFTTDEFRCPCDCGFGEKEDDIDKMLINTLNMMRLLYGKPLVVTSGARCEEYNRKIGGVADSAHLPDVSDNRCHAVDILVNNSSQRMALVSIALKLGISRIGIASNFLHFDTSWDLPQPVIFNY